MRFRKRVKIFPGFSLNFSNSGISSTIGVKGASINFSKNGTYLNTGIPGTGFYNRQKLSGGSSKSDKFINQDLPSESIIIEEPISLRNEIKSAETNKLTSASLVELKEALLEAYKDRNELHAEIELTRKQLKTAKAIYIVSCIFIIGLVNKSFKTKVNEKEEYLSDLNEQLQNCFVNIDIHFDKAFENKYKNVLNSYNALLASEIIWDITSSTQQDSRQTRSAASVVVTRTPVKFKFDNIDIIKSQYSAFHFENKNGGDLYIYPAFVIMTNDKKEFGLIDIKEFNLNFAGSKFLEEEKIPSDTKVIDKTWAKVNKNGQPDKRFKGNYEIPIVKYGQFTITSNTGLNESYSISSYEKAEAFAESFIDYQNSL
jgi:hypothetical protein